MTATMSAADLASVLKRADARYADRFGDEPAPPEYLTALEQAVRPLLQGADGPAQQVDDGRVQQLLDDKQRLGDLVVELRKHVASRDKTIDRQSREITDLKTQRAELERARADARQDTERRIDAAVRAVEAAARTEAERLSQAVVDAQTVGVQRLRADNVKLAEDLAERSRELAAARRDAATWESEYERVRDEKLTDLATDLEERAEHGHAYPWPDPTRDPEPCECGQPWPRGALAAPTEDVAPDREVWPAFFDRVRAELKGWPG